MNITEDAKQRVEWIDKRVQLNDLQKEYVEFQIKEAIANAQRENKSSTVNSEVQKAGELKDEHLIFLDDDMYLPIHYKGMKVKEPFYEGEGNHSVAQLEAISGQYKEFAHQQSVIKTSCMKHIVELKFGVDFNNTTSNELPLRKDCEYNNHDQCECVGKYCEYGK